MAAQSTILALCLAAVAARQTPAALRPAALRVRGGSTAAEENANARIEKLRRLGEDAGFVAALDQSGGSTPKALADYGVEPSAYDGDEAMYDAVHAMCERVVQSPAFDDRVLAAILFENKGWAISLFQVMSTHARLGLALIESGPVDDAEANGCPYAWIAEHKPKAEADVANAVKYEKS